jgi:PAB1-binding protein PBP1
VPAGNKGVGGFGTPSRDRLVYLTTCLIGQHVEVQTNDGAVYSGIFHSADAEGDFGILLKMARLTKAGSSQGQKSISDSVSKPPTKSFIIPAARLVQLTAKGVSVTRDAGNEIQREKQQEMMTDSSISQSYHADAERELERWVPDEDNPECPPELENIFDDPWNRGWDQFEANEALFGVKSTFNEELYTTKLARGPQTRDLEREALRIAKEIEAEDTKDIHLAEERGIQIHGIRELDEETRYSSVLRGVDDSGYDETEDEDSHNMETFGDISHDDAIITKSFADLSIRKSNDRAQLASSSLYMGEMQGSQASAGRNLSGSNDQAKLLPHDFLSTSAPVFGGESSNQGNSSTSTKHHGGINYSQENIGRQTLAEEAQSSKIEDPESSKKDINGLSPNATAFVSSKGQEKPSSSDRDAVKTQATTSTSSSSDPAVPSSNTPPPPQLSRTSSVASQTSEKSSTLNPYAKEFRLNPNAKSFVPTKSPVRPASPAPDNSFYYPPPSPVQHIHNVPLGVGIGPSFPGQHQPVMFNPQAAAPHMQPPPQPYFYPGGPQYGQQMMIGQQRPLVYLPNYPAEMQYKGRDY